MQIPENIFIFNYETPGTTSCSHNNCLVFACAIHSLVYAKLVVDLGMANSKTGFGLDQVVNETPPFANWIFRGYFIISKAAIGWIAAVGLFPTKTQFVVVTTVSLLLDPIVLGFSKLFGIIPEPIDPDQKLVADKQVDEKGEVSKINPVVVDPPK